MQDIAELERRITAALERIAIRIDRPVDLADAEAPAEVVAPPAAPGDDPLSAEIDRLTMALDEEQMANAQLAERLRVVREKEARLRAALEDQIADLMRQLDMQGLELSRAHHTMVQQGGQLRSLREAVEAQVADPALINRTMEIEMEALRATRGAEVAELSGILSALDPLIAPEGAADARA